MARKLIDRRLQRLTQICGALAIEQDFSTGHET